MRRKGEVLERVVTPGQYVKVQTPVMSIVDIDILRVRLKIPEKMTELVHVGICERFGRAYKTKRQVRSPESILQSINKAVLLKSKLCSETPKDS